MFTRWLTLLLLQLSTAEMMSTLYKRPGLTIIHLPANSTDRNSIDRNVDLPNICMSSMIVMHYFDCAQQQIRAEILNVFTVHEVQSKTVFNVEPFTPSGYLQETMSPTTEPTEFTESFTLSPLSPTIQPSNIPQSLAPESSPSSFLPTLQPSNIPRSLAPVSSPIQLSPTTQPSNIPRSLAPISPSPPSSYLRQIDILLQQVRQIIVSGCEPINVEPFQ